MTDANNGALESLKTMFADRCVTDEPSLRRHSVDQVGDDAYARRPAAVVFPVTPRSAGAYHSLEDVVVPPASVSLLVEHVAELRERHGLAIALFGHAGDGNFHVTPMKPAAMPTEQWPARIDALLRELYAEVLRLGGRSDVDNALLSRGATDGTS